MLIGILMASTIFLLFWVLVLTWKSNRNIGGWSIDDICWNKVAPMLKGRYAGVCYSMLTSNSPVIIRHRQPLTSRQMRMLARLFPENIRVEFQEVTYEGEKNYLFGRGDLGPPDLHALFKAPDWVVDRRPGLK